MLDRRWRAALRAVRAACRPPRRNQGRSAPLRRAPAPSRARRAARGAARAQRPVRRTPDPPVAVPARRRRRQARRTTAFDAKQRALVERVNAYLSGVQTLVGDFVQVGPDGRRTEGQFYLQKPGRLRFEYDAPSPIELIADGTSVVVRDRKLATQDLYPLSQTPLRFLLADRIDLIKDTNVVGVIADDTFVTVMIEEKQTLGGTHRLMLMFGARTCSSSSGPSPIRRATTPLSRSTISTPAEARPGAVQDRLDPLPAIGMIPKEWEPVFGKIIAQPKKLKRDDEAR